MVIHLQPEIRYSTDELQQRGLVVCGHFCLFVLKLLATGNSLEDAVFSRHKFREKFGSHSRKRVSRWRMLKDLDMNDNRITSLGCPKYSLDAVAKRWVNQQLKDGMKDIDEFDSVCKRIQMTIKQMQTEYDSSIKELTKR